MAGEMVLVVDDEQHILDVVVYILEENAFKVVTAPDGTTALRLVGERRPDLVILDLMLPDVTGFDLLKEIRKGNETIPVIMLTSRCEEIDRVLGLELGADDYVTKPFSTRELLARVRAILRRSGTGNNDSDLIRNGLITVDRAAYKVEYSGQQVPLTRSEFKFMECLARYPARVFTREEIINYIYDSTHVVTDRSIDAYVKRIRKKLSAVRSDIDPVETVHGLGYKLNQNVETTEL